MADLKQGVANVDAAVTKMEARVTAHEENLKAVSADLQKQIDDLKSGTVNTEEAAAALLSLQARIDAFDADQPA